MLTTYRLVLTVAALLGLGMNVGLLGMVTAYQARLGHYWLAVLYIAAAASTCLITATRRLLDLRDAHPVTVFDVIVLLPLGLSIAAAIVGWQILGKVTAPGVHDD